MVPGPQSQKVIARQQAREGAIVSYGRNMPIAIKRAKGAVIEDMDGNHFLDFFACAGVLNVGHCNEYVLKYVREQQDSLIHALDFPTENKADLIDKILDQLPEEMREAYKLSFVSPSGSDAVEAAIKLAKHKTGRSGVISFYGGYHGMTAGSVSVTSNVFFRKDLSTMVPNVHFIPYPYSYRNPLGEAPEKCNLLCLDYLENLLENPHSGIETPAAIIIEPIQGEGGVVIPPDGFLEKLVEIAHRHGVIVIFDEIQAGFFRTGKFLSSMHTQARADIYTISKGIGGIGFPLAGIIYKKEIESWGSGKHVGTFRGNQVAIAAGIGAMDFVEEMNLESHVITLGAYMKDRLEKLAQQMPFIGEVRGRGLFFGLEYIQGPQSKKPDATLASRIRKRCFQNGLIFETGGHFNNVIRLLPPLIITRELADRALDILEEAHRYFHSEQTANESDQLVAVPS